MFSHYDPDYQYDRVLIQNFIIEAEQKRPAPIDELKKRVEERLRDIEYHEPFITWYTGNSYLAQRIRGILRYCKKRLRLYQVLQIDGQNYFETPVGNIELQYVEDYTKFILSELRMNHNEKFDEYVKDVVNGKFTFSWQRDSLTSGTTY